MKKKSNPTQHYQQEREDIDIDLLDLMWKFAREIEGAARSRQICSQAKNLRGKVEKKHCPGN